MKASDRADRVLKYIAWDVVFRRRRAAPRDRAAVRQWALVGSLGIALGITTLAIVTLPPRLIPLFLLAVLFPFAVLIVGNVRRLFLAIIVLDIPLQLDVNLAYRADAAQLGALSGFNISITTISLVALYTLWLSEYLVRAKDRPRLSLHTSLPFALYLGFAILSILFAADSALSSFKIFLILQMFLLYIYIVSSVQTRQDVLFIVAMLLIGFVLESLIMILLGLAGINFSIAGVSSRIDVGKGPTGPPYRFSGTIGSSNTAASYVSMLMTIAVSLLFTRLKLWYRLLAILGFGLGGVALILTFSRGGWLSFVLSITMVCLFTWRRGWLSLTVPFAIAIVLAMLSLLFRDAVTARVQETNLTHARVILNELAFKMIIDNPVFGIGTNNFAIAMKQYLTPEFGGEWIYIVHNKYLLEWAEIGIGGIVAFVWFLLAAIRRGWQCYQFEGRFLPALALGLTAGIIGHMSQMFAEPFNGRPSTQLLYLTAGLITVIHNIGRGAVRASSNAREDVA
jgi:putative inorganic carbon (HCO3(-)) transporter